MEQPKKPGAGPTKDITDLKARLGLQRPGAPGPAAPMPPNFGPPRGPMPGGPAPGGPMPGPAAPMAQAPNPFASFPGGGPAPGAAAPGPQGPAPSPFLGQPAGAAPAQKSASIDPYANMRPQQGKQFDLKLVDDGAPVAKMRSGGGKGIIVAGAIFGLAGFVIGAGLGISSVGRANMNTANRSARVVKTEVDSMQKKIAQINIVVNQSRQRLGAGKKDPFTYDPQLTADLEKIPLDPRPSTEKIFRADYMRLEDMVVDQLFNYYYDTLALYGEIERHVKRTKNDADSLTAFLQKEGAKQASNYGVVFDTSGKLAVANLVEVGEPTCKGGKSGKDCTGDLEGFKVRMNSGAPWSERKLDPKSEGRVVPLKPTPFMDAVMSGSPDQVRFENYKARVATIFVTLGRINNASKELTKGLEKAATRPDIFAPLSF